MGQYRNNRKKLSTTLKTICKNVYYQQPDDGVTYPCIVYKLLRPTIKKADDINYKREDTYEVTYITKDILDDNYDNLLDIDHCSFVTHFISDSLHHFVYNIYI